MRPSDLTAGIRYRAGTLPLTAEPAVSVPLCARVEEISGRSVLVTWVHVDKLRSVSDTSQLPERIPPRQIERLWSTADWHQIAAVTRRQELAAAQAQLADETAERLTRLTSVRFNQPSHVSSRTRHHGSNLHTAMQVDAMRFADAAALLEELATALGGWHGPGVSIKIDGLTAGALHHLYDAVTATLGAETSALASLLDDLLKNTDEPPTDRTDPAC